MQPDTRDAAYLWDMRQAALEVLGFTEGATFAEYVGNRMLKLAVERGLEIVGEAARRVSIDFREAHPQIPWRQIVAQRNVLIHEYGEIEEVLVWEVIQQQLPPLVEQLESLIPQPPIARDTP
jgi:uncharacterized protein with HEPN domain